MTDSAFITMVVVLSLVWGGFSALLVYAMRRESRRRHEEDGSKS